MTAAECCCHEWLNLSSTGCVTELGDFATLFFSWFVNTVLNVINRNLKKKSKFFYICIVFICVKTK